jgi:mono/diheme cytochrome c family protein
VKILFLFLLFLSLEADDAKYKEGRVLYLETCISCHDTDGQANSGVRFIVQPRNLQKSILNEEQTYAVIAKGTHYWGSRADIMPSFESVLKKKQIEALVYYISQRFNPVAAQKVKNLYQKHTKDVVVDEKMEQVGAKIYTTKCALCHGVDGKGDGVFTKSSTKLILPYDFHKTILSKEQLFLYTKFGGKFFGAKTDTMHSWGDTYTDYELLSVVKYIQNNFKKEAN